MLIPESEGTGRRHRRAEDRRRIFLAKTVRAVAYGALSGFLYLYLAQDLGFPVLSSLLLTALSLIGAAVANLAALPPLEHRFGRRGALRIFGFLFLGSAVLLFLAAQPVLVLVAVLVGGVAASSTDNGPMASLDQAILPSTMRREDRPAGFARYNLIGSFASAAGALLLVLPGALTPRAIPVLPPAPHPWIGLLYIVLAGATLFAYWDLSEEAEPRASMDPVPRPAMDPARRRAVRTLTVLFGVDAFAGGMVINPLLTAYFVLAWQQSSESVGAILFIVGVVSGLSFLVASRLAAKFGLLPTMVFTHLPSNVLLVLVPFMPTFGLALTMLIARSALSQMDVPTRQAYTMDLVPDAERATVAGTLAGSRSVAQSIGPFPALVLQASGALAAPFVIAGGLKSAYDVVLWHRFRGERGVDEAL